MVKLCNVADAFQADQIVALLMDNGIQAYKQGVGTGGYTHIVARVSAMGYDILVDENKVEMACQLVRTLVEIEDDENAEEKKGIPWQRIIAIVMLLGIVFVLALGYFQ